MSTVGFDLDYKPSSDEEYENVDELMARLKLAVEQKKSPKKVKKTTPTPKPTANRLTARDIRVQTLLNCY